MNNTRLERDIDRATSTIEGVISDLVAEIEEKEATIDTLTDKIDELEEQLKDLKHG